MPYAENTQTEGQRYFFLGGTTTLTRTQSDGGKGSAAIFSWARGNKIAVVIGGYASVQVSGSFDYAVFLNGIANGELYEFTKNSAHYTAGGSDVSEIYGLRHDESINHLLQPGGGDLWNNVVNNVAYWQAICNINGTNELQNQSLEGKFLGDVDFAKL